jgi:hypothetical protein
LANAITLNVFEEAIRACIRMWRLNSSANTGQ